MNPFKHPILMSESGDYDPGPWGGYDFKEARASYTSNVVNRSYDDAKTSKKTKKDYVPKSITTDSEAPVLIVCDVTNSMGSWPADIFAKLPYLDLEGKEYLGDTMAVSFIAVGDGFSDTHPLQVQEFSTGKDMEKCLKNLVIEKGGGSGFRESYDLAALYALNNVECPKAIRKPILIFIGDEALYNFVDKNLGEQWCYTKMKSSMSIEELFEQLRKKYSVYAILKPYGNSGTNVNEYSGTSKTVYEQWEGLLGADRIAMLPEAGRVVDVIFGLLANDTGRIEYFEEELKGRQTGAQVQTVMRSLATIHKAPVTVPKAKKIPKSQQPQGQVQHSVTRRHNDDENTKKSKSLID